MGFFSRIFRWNEFATESQPPSHGASERGLDAQTAQAVLDELDIDTAIAAHENWSARLTAVIRGSSEEDLSPDLVCRDDHCDLGRWLHGPGRERLGQYPAFSMLVTRHQHFHLEAATVLSLAQAGETEKAERKLQSGYRHASTQVVLLLKEMRRGLRGY